MSAGGGHGATPPAAAGTIAAARDRGSASRRRDSGLPSTFQFQVRSWGGDAQHQETVEAAAAPAPWHEYAQHLVQVLGQWLEEDSETPQRIRARLRDLQAQDAQRMLCLRLWIERRGLIADLDCDGLRDRQMAVELGSLLVGRRLPMRPPPSMPQPLQLALGFRTAIC